MWNFVCNHIFSCSKRNLKITFFSRAPFNVQIFQKYFTNIFICQIIIKYLELVFTDHIQLVPQFFHILPAACCDCNWFYCKSFFCIWPCSTSPQIYIKSETEQRTISKYSVWNNQISIKWEQRNKFSLLELLLKDSHIVHWMMVKHALNKFLIVKCF